ncbi:MAG: tetratricopeptide repeat protein [Thermodesulfobacteriota bacterium]
MTTKSTIGCKKTRPRELFSSLLRPMAEAGKGCSGGGCRARALTRLNREGMAACQSGSYEVARRLLTEGITLARRAGVSMYEAKLRNNLGLVHLLAARPCDAAVEFGQALDLVEGKLGRENPLFRRIAGNLKQARCI